MRRPSPQRTALALCGLAGCGALLLTAGLVRGETLEYRDEAVGKRRGKILAEFEDTLFVALDGAQTEFVPRAALRAIEDAEGQRFEAPHQPGTFARYDGTSPAGAATDPQGDVFVAVAGEQGADPVPPQGHLFVRPGDRVKTAEDALGRLLMTSNAQLKLGPGTEVLAEEPQGRERLKLIRGEVFLETRHRPLDLALGDAVRFETGADARVELQAADGAARVLVHSGRTEAAWVDARLVFEPGTGAELAARGAAQWEVTADATNVADLEIHLPAGTERLAPGQSRTFGAQADRQGMLWRLLTSSGELLLRRAQADGFSVVDPDELELLVLGEGDALRTAAGGAATLGRIDGAAISLAAVSQVRLTPAALELSGGTLQVESVASPVKVKTPGGVAGLRQSITRLERRDDATLELACKAGTAEIPLADLGVVQVAAGAGAELRAFTDGPTQVRLLQGQGTFVTRARAGGYDPDVQVALRQGDVIGLEADDDGRHVLHLPGERWLRCEGPGLRARLSLAAADPLISFASGAEVVMLEKLGMGLGRRENVPELRFRSGPRIQLTHPFRMQVHNPTAIIEGPGGSQTTVAFEGDLEVSLDDGTEHAVATLSVRESDRLEVLDATSASLTRVDGQHRYDLGDGRQLWIADGAPPVQARLADAAGTAYLTMPGAPALGLAAGRSVVVLATSDGEFVVVSGAGADIGDGGLEPLSAAGQASTIDRISRDRFRDLLDVPQVDSPSGP